VTPRFGAKAAGFAANRADAGADFTPAESAFCSLRVTTAWCQPSSQRLVRHLTGLVHVSFNMHLSHGHPCLMQCGNKLPLKARRVCAPKLMATQSGCVVDHCSWLISAPALYARIGSAQTKKRKSHHDQPRTTERPAAFVQGWNPSSQFWLRARTLFSWRCRVLGALQGLATGFRT